MQITVANALLLFLAKEEHMVVIEIRSYQATTVGSGSMTEICFINMFHAMLYD